jgi:hypothetical protein
VGERVQVTVVDDCSLQPGEAHHLQGAGIPVEVVELRTNLGHQKAIAVGLCQVAAAGIAPEDRVVVMDADGEDDPAQIPDLLQATASKPPRLVFARRRKRHEPLWFQLGYRLYKTLFRWATGVEIAFGNYSVIPASLLPQVVALPDLWNHYSGAILKAGLPYSSIPLDRGTRYAGTSRMNFTRLVLHGLSAITVQLETVAVRLLMGTLGIAVASLGYLALVLVHKLVLRIAIPGWASTVGIGALSLALQSLMMAVLLVFLVLAKRNTALASPDRFFADYIRERRRYGPA